MDAAWLETAADLTKVPLVQKGAVQLEEMEGNMELGEVLCQGLGMDSNNLDDTQWCVTNA